MASEQPVVASKHSQPAGTVEIDSLLEQEVVVQASFDQDAVASSGGAASDDQHHPPLISGAAHLSSQVVYRQKWLQMSLIRYRDEDGRELPWDSCERTTRVPGADCDGVEIIARLCHYQPSEAEIRQQGQADPDEPWYVLVRQYRPPVQAYVLEFPAGLLDALPDPEQASAASAAQDGDNNNDSQENNSGDNDNNNDNNSNDNGGNGDSGDKDAKPSSSDKLTAARWESVAECALRELREETGYLGQVEPLPPHQGNAFVSHLSAPEPGLSNALGRMVAVYVDCRRPENQTANLRQELDENERIQVLRVRQNKLFEYAQQRGARGDIVDCKLYTFALGLQFALPNARL